MSSSSRPRARVIRGGVGVAVKAVPFAVDLTAAAPSKVDPAAVEEAVTTGYRDGFESGRHEGYQAGMAAARAELAAADQERAAVVQQAVEALQHAITALRHAQAATLAGVEDDLAGGAFAIAEAVLDRSRGDLGHGRRGEVDGEGHRFDRHRRAAADHAGAGPTRRTHQRSSTPRSGRPLRGHG